MTELIPFLGALFVIAVLYGSIGHGGASGYLAVMAVFGMTAASMKPTALTLNVIVSLIGTVAFLRAGHFSWSLFSPFAVVSAPFAYLGGRAGISPGLFRWLVAVALLFAAVRLFVPVRGKVGLHPPPIWAVGAAGASIGTLSGLIGVGGGIFLTPLLLICGWANPKTAAAVSAPFILVNSAAALLGHVESMNNLPEAWSWFVTATVTGGFIGSLWGSGVAKQIHLRLALALVLAFAAAKFAIT